MPARFLVLKRVICRVVVFATGGHTATNFSPAKKSGDSNPNGKRKIVIYRL